MSILHFSNFCLEARNGEEGVVLQCDILTAYLLQLLPNFGFNWNRFSLPPCNTIKQNPRQLCMDSLSHIAHKSAMENTQASLSLTNISRQQIFPSSATKESYLAIHLPPLFPSP